MGITTLSVLGLIVQIVGFVCLCRLGGHLSDSLERKSQWLPLVVGGVVIAATVVFGFTVGQPLPFVAQTLGLFGIAFGGGLVAQQRDRIEGELLREVTAKREKLLAQISQVVQRYFGVTTALEHNAGDYEGADMLSHGRTGKPIALWTFDGDKINGQPYDDQKAPLYFHIDVANNRAVIVKPSGCLSGGGGYVLDGATQTCEPRWRS